MPVSPVHGILQTRRLGWLAMPFSRGSPRPRDQTLVSHWQVGSLPLALSGKPTAHLIILKEEAISVPTVVRTGMRSSSRVPVAGELERKCSYGLTLVKGQRAVVTVWLLSPDPFSSFEIPSTYSHLFSLTFALVFRIPFLPS